MPSHSVAPGDDPKSFLEASLPEIVAAVRSVCRLYHIQNDLVDDICQQIAVSLIENDYRRLRSFDREKSAFKTWLIAVVKNYIRNELRKMGDGNRGAGGSLAAAYHPAQELMLIAKEFQDRLGAAICRLSNRDRELAELVFRDDLSAPEIAARMGITVESVYRRKHAIAKKLSVMLDVRSWSLGLVNSRSCPDSAV